MLLRVENLRVFYGRREIIKGLNLEVDFGQIVCVVGESGSGKTTLLKSIVKLKDFLVEGKVLFKGTDLNKLSERELSKFRGREIGFIFQEPSLYLDPLFSIKEQLLECCKRDLGEVERVLREVGLYETERILRSYPHQLSGGQKQRVLIASVLLQEPSLILADEPTTALDLPTQKKILQIFRNLKKKGKSMLLVTHDFGVVAEVGDYVLVLKDGRVVEEGDVYTIFESPKEDYTKELLSSAFIE